jgi:hypothetical protein
MDSAKTTKSLLRLKYFISTMATLMYRLAQIDTLTLSEQQLNT